MSSSSILALNLLMSLTSFALIAKWYVLPHLTKLPRTLALEPLVLLNTFRHLAMMFLAPGAVAGELPELFAYPAAIAGLIASLLAFAALIALRLRSAVAVPLVWVFNVEGTLHLLYSVARGALDQAAAQMGPTFWIPAVLVPAFLVIHFMVFLLLLRRDSPEEQQPGEVGA